MLAEHPYGFRVQHSTEYAAIKLFDHISKEMDSLTDYLTNRKQCVVFNNHCSDITDIVNVVPQGSILGPLNFSRSIHINDLIRTSNKFKFIIYADDTTVYFNLKDFDPDNVSNEIKNELVKITKWLQINKLSLNIELSRILDFNLLNFFGYWTLN